MLKSLLNVAVVAGSLSEVGGSVEEEHIGRKAGRALGFSKLFATNFGLSELMEFLDEPDGQSVFPVFRQISKHTRDMMVGERPVTLGLAVSAEFMTNPVYREHVLNHLSDAVKLTLNGFPTDLAPLAEPRKLSLTFRVILSVQEVNQLLQSNLVVLELLGGVKPLPETYTEDLEIPRPNLQSLSLGNTPIEVQKHILRSARNLKSLSFVGCPTDFAQLRNEIRHLESLEVMAFEHLELDHLECLPRSLVQLTWSTENGDHIFRIPRLPHLKSLVWTGPLDVRQLGKFGALESLSIAPSSVGGCSRTVRLDGIEEAAPGLQILRMRCASLGILGGIAHTMTELQELSLVNIEILNFGLAPLKYLPNLKKLTLSESVRIGCETVDVHALGISHFQSLKELDISMLDTSQNDAIHHPFFDHLTSSWEDLLRDVFRGALPPILDTIVVSDEQVHLLEGLNIESKQEVKTDEYSSKWIIKLKNT